MQFYDLFVKPDNMIFCYNLAILLAGRLVDCVKMDPEEEPSV